MYTAVFLSKGGTMGAPPPFNFKVSGTNFKIKRWESGMGCKM